MNPMGFIYLSPMRNERLQRDLCYSMHAYDMLLCVLHMLLTHAHILEYECQ